MAIESFPALTVHQPWAWAIGRGIKKIENRSWRCNYRGPVWIHAGKSRGSLDDGCDFLIEIGAMSAAEANELSGSDSSFGAIVGRASIVDCLEWSEKRFGDDPFAGGPWCFVLEGAVAFRPIAATGQCGLWRPSTELSERCDRAMTSSLAGRLKK